MNSTVAKFVPDDFEVPLSLETDRFHLRMLSVNDVHLDYDAVMSSREHLRSIFEQNDVWPADDMTLEDNYKDLRRHQEEFLKREAFAYTVMNLDEDQCLGCVYIKPTGKKYYDAAVFLWVRASKLAIGLDKELFDCVRNWVASVWPFQRVGFPGREIGWNEWIEAP